MSVDDEPAGTAESPKGRRRNPGLRRRRPPRRQRYDVRMGTRLRQIKKDIRKRLAASFYRLPLGLRRAAAVVVTLSISLFVGFFCVDGHTDFKESGELVRTQDHQPSLIIRIFERRGFDNTRYYVQTEEGPSRVHYPEFLPDKHVNAFAEYVIDPRNPYRVIAVGTPEDWEQMPARRLWVQAGMVVFGLALIPAAWSRIAPEDTRALAQKLFPRRQLRDQSRRDLPPESGGSSLHIR